MSGEYQFMGIKRMNGGIWPDGLSNISFRAQELDG